MSDFTVDQLFRPRQPLVLGETTIYVRALSDFELQLASRQALEAGGRELRALKDPSSGAYLALIEPLLSAEDDVLRVSIGHMSMRRLYQESAKAHLFQHQPFPDNASEEEKAETLERRVKFAADLQTKRNEHVTKALEALKENLQSRETPWLKSEAIKLSQELARLAAFTDEHAWQAVLLSTETEDGEPYFPNIQMVRALGRQAMDLIYAKFEEVNELDPLASKSPSLTA